LLFIFIHAVPSIFPSVTLTPSTLEAPKFVLRVRFAVNLLELIRPQKKIEDAFVFSLLHNCPASSGTGR
jgi:hypothetical protein